jgi:hypothetical protein
MKDKVWKDVKELTPQELAHLFGGNGDSGGPLAPDPDDDDDSDSGG